MNEIETYRNNLVSFLNDMQGSVLEKLIFDIDIAPTFDKAALPFEFEYCYSVTFITNTGILKLLTSMTDSSLSSFWTESVEAIESKGNIKEIKSKVKAVHYTARFCRLPYKISIELQNNDLIIYAAEIYDTVNGKYEYKINDEMLFVFEDKREAEKFEAAL